MGGCTEALGRGSFMPALYWGKKERLRRHSGIYMVREWLRVPQDFLRKTYEIHWRT